MEPTITPKILWVDLTNHKTWEERLDPDIYRLLPGGRGLGAYLLLRHLPPGTEPLSPENILILANGVLTGAPFSTATRYSAIARSPLTGGYGESEAGGFWGPELKSAGWEAIVFLGRSPQPVYLWIRDDQVEIRDGAHLWGREPAQVQEILRQELGQKHIRLLMIGLGAENLVRFAGMTNEMRHFNARTGMGAVMGSKNLKAVAVSGSERFVDHSQDGKAILELGRRLAKGLKDHPLGWDLHEHGTPILPAGLNAGGILPTRNFRGGGFEGVESLRFEAYEREILIGHKSCFACAVRCKPEVKVNGQASPYGGPEYETVASFGSNCGIDQIQAVAIANEMCNRYTLDSISTGGVIAFAMECFERGLLTLEDTGGLEVRFGNVEVMLRLVEMIARREGFGNVLAEGVRRLAEGLGGEAMKFAMHAKGQEFPMHEPRGKVGVGIAYAITEAGADHLVAVHDTMLSNPEALGFKGAKPLGIVEALPNRELSPQKVRHFLILENWNSFEKVAGLCFFGPAPRSFIPVEEVLLAMRAATGWELEVQDLLDMGERATNLARIFNVREGFSRKDDTLPDRMFEPLDSGALTGVAIDREQFEKSLDELYEYKDWGLESGLPSRERLRRLGIEWAAGFFPS